MEARQLHYYPYHLNGMGPIKVPPITYGSWVLSRFVFYFNDSTMVVFLQSGDGQSELAQCVCGSCHASLRRDRWRDRGSIPPGSEPDKKRCRGSGCTSNIDEPDRFLLCLMNINFPCNDHQLPPEPNVHL